MAYGPAGELSAVTDAKTRDTVYDYDALGRRIKELDPAGRTTRYAYDDRDNLLAVTNANDVVIRRYQYDRTDRLIKEIRPDGTLFEYRYDDKEGTVTRIDAKGQKTRYHKDKAGRLIRIELSRPECPRASGS